MYPTPRVRARRPLPACSGLAALLLALAASPEARAQKACFPSCSGEGPGFSTAGKISTPAIGGQVGGQTEGQVGGQAGAAWAASTWTGAIATLNASLAAAGALWPAGGVPSAEPASSPPSAAPEPDWGARPASSPRRLPPRTRLGGCLGMQMGIADHEPRPVLCAVLRAHAFTHWSFGLDGTYSFGSDDGNSMAFGEAPPAPFRHEVGAWPNAALHFLSDERASLYLRFGGTGLVAPMRGPGWSETRTYVGGHVGLGFDAYARRSLGFGIDMVGFVVARLDDSPRPDAPAGSASTSRGGGGAQLRVTLAYDFIGRDRGAYAGARFRSSRSSL